MCVCVFVCLAAVSKTKFQISRLSLNFETEAETVILVEILRSSLRLSFNFKSKFETEIF